MPWEQLAMSGTIDSDDAYGGGALDAIRVVGDVNGKDQLA
jgi:hypothetical protein